MTFTYFVVFNVDSVNTHTHLFAGEHSHAINEFFQTIIRTDKLIITEEDIQRLYDEVVSRFNSNTLPMNDVEPLDELDHLTLISYHWTGETNETAEV